jgi:hypothetical protein
MALAPRVSTIPTYMHGFYAVRYAQFPCRFRDRPAMRGFVSYQLRLVNALLSIAKGFEAEDPATLIRLNPYLIASDFDELVTVFDHLVKHDLVKADLVALARPRLAELHESFLSRQGNGA